MSLTESPWMHVHHMPKAQTTHHNHAAMEQSKPRQLLKISLARLAAAETEVSYLKRMDACPSNPNIETTGEQSEHWALPDSYENIVRRRVNGKTCAGGHNAALQEMQASPT